MFRQHNPTQSAPSGPLTLEFTYSKNDTSPQEVETALEKMTQAGKQTLKISGNSKALKAAFSRNATYFAHVKIVGLLDWIHDILPESETYKGLDALPEHLFRNTLEISPSPDLPHTTHDENVISFLATKVIGACDIRGLIIKNLGLNDAAISEIIPHIDGSVASLNVSGNDFYEFGLEAISDRLNKVGLSELDLSNNQFNPEYFWQFFVKFKNNYRLRHLNLGNCTLDLAQCAALTGSLSRNENYLTSLNLTNTQKNGNNLDSETFYYNLFLAIAKNRYLKAIDLSNDSLETVTPDIFKALMLVVSQNTRLHTLILPSMFFEENNPHLADLINTLKLNTTLTSLTHDNDFKKLPPAIQAVLERNNAIARQESALIGIFMSENYLETQEACEELRIKADAFEKMIDTLSHNTPEICFPEKTITIKNAAVGLYILMARYKKVTDIMNSDALLTSPHALSENVETLQSEKQSILSLLETHAFIARSKLNKTLHYPVLILRILKPARIAHQAICTKGFLANNLGTLKKLETFIRFEFYGLSPADKLPPSLERLHKLAVKTHALIPHAFRLLHAILSKEFQYHNTIFTGMHAKLCNEIEEMNSLYPDTDIPDEILEVKRLAEALLALHHGWRTVWTPLTTPFISPKLQVIADTELAYAMLASPTPLTHKQYRYALWLLRHEIRKPDHHPGIDMLVANIQSHLMINTGLTLEYSAYKQRATLNTLLPILFPALSRNVPLSKKALDQHFLKKAVLRSLRDNTEHPHATNAIQGLKNSIEKDFENESNNTPIERVIPYVKTLFGSPLPEPEVMTEIALDTLFPDTENPFCVLTPEEQAKKTKIAGRMIQLRYDQINRLDLTEDNLDETDVSNLLAALSDNTSVTSILLSGKTMSEASLAVIAAHLRRSTTIENCQVKHVRDNAFLANLIEHAHLKALDMSLCGVPSSERILSALANTTLASIDLSYCMVSDYIAGKLATILKSNTSLKTVKLNGNCITQKGANALLDALAHNHTLTELSLEDNLFRKSHFNTLLRERLERNRRTANTGSLKTAATLYGSSVDRNIVSQEHEKKRKHGCQ